jgi:hypothetical protein
MMHSTLKNLLAIVPKLNCIILKQTGSKSRCGATNKMHAEQVLKKNEIIDRNTERKIFPFDPNNIRKLTEGELFSYYYQTEAAFTFICN